MLTESFLIALLGAIVGAGAGAIGRWISLVRKSRARHSFSSPYWISFTIDAKVLGFTLGAVLLATLVSGLVPPARSARNASEMMKEGGRGNSSRLRQHHHRASSWSARSR